MIPLIPERGVENGSRRAATKRPYLWCWWERCLWARPWLSVSSSPLGWGGGRPCSTSDLQTGSPPLRRPAESVASWRAEIYHPPLMRLWTGVKSATKMETETYRFTRICIKWQITSVSFVLWSFDVSFLMHWSWDLFDLFWSAAAVSATTSKPICPLILWSVKASLIHWSWDVFSSQAQAWKTPCLSRTHTQRYHSLTVSVLSVTFKGLYGFKCVFMHHESQIIHSFKHRKLFQQTGWRWHDKNKSDSVRK